MSVVALRRMLHALCNMTNTANRGYVGMVFIALCVRSFLMKTDAYTPLREATSMEPQDEASRQRLYSGLNVIDISRQKLQSY